MQLLRLLSNGLTQSGEALGGVLGVSRTIVWRRVAAWRRRGIEIETIPTKGYRLQAPIQWWVREAILAELTPQAQQALNILVIEDSVGSTNDRVMELLRGSKQSGVACLAEEQTAGRGRRGREWLSPVGANFYGSIGWQFSSVANLEGLSLAVGVALVKALRRAGITNAQLKWPNDIVVGGAKLGGVLIELQAEADGPCSAVVGVGINLQPCAGALKLGRPVTDVASHLSGEMNKNKVGALLLEEMLLLLREYSGVGFAGWRTEWLRLDALCDANVMVTGLHEDVAGIARGVNESGALCVETTSGLRLFHAGEVSLRERST